MTKEKLISRKFQFTEKKISKLPPNDKDSKSTDCEWSDAIVPGLKIFCSKKPGVKSYHLRYVINNRKRVVKISDFKCLPLSEVRDIARKYRGMISKGIDPLEERQKIRDVPDLKTFSQVYLDWCRIHKRSWHSDELLLKNSIIPALGSMQLSHISKQDITAYLDQLRQRLNPATINRHRSVISKLISYAIELEVIEGDNICKKVKKLVETPPPIRFLDENDLRNLLTILDNYPENRTAKFIKFLLYTGLRRGEVLKMEWEHTETIGQVFIPAANCKGKRSRYVQINSLGQKTLEELKKLKVDGSIFVFPGLKPGKHMVNPTKLWMKIRIEAGIPDMKLHQLRHHFAKISLSQGASMYFVQKMLGHANQKTTQVYAHLAKSDISTQVELVAQSINRTMNQQQDTSI